MEIPEENIQNAKVEEEEEEPQAKTVEIQTMYRESETQTNPFSPDYILERGADPEVVSIEKLTYGKGLPASMTEMQLIEKKWELLWETGLWECSTSYFRWSLLRPET